MRLNLEWVDAFVDFADHLNFTHAARARHVSQPALHGQVRQLQAAVGAPLYHRRGRNLELSEAGRQLAAFGRELRVRERGLLAQLRGPQADAPVILQAGEGAYLYLLGPALRRFAHGRGELLRLRLGDAETTLRAVEDGLVDIGVLPLARLCPKTLPRSHDTAPDDHGGVARTRRMLDTPSSSRLALAAADGALTTREGFRTKPCIPAGIEAEPLAEVGQMLVVPRTHPLAERAAIELRELAGQRLIVAPEDRPHRRALAAALANQGIAWEVAVEVSGWALMIQLVGLGVGLAVVNDFCRLPRNLVGVPVPELARLDYAAIRREGLPVSPASARLWQLLTG
jgi:LysR family transcriptional regulator, low CO2-responsive transcriptional regulator